MISCGMWRAQHSKNHEAAFVCVCLHFVQEDQPETTDCAIADWYRRNFAPSSIVWFAVPNPRAPRTHKSEWPDVHKRRSNDSFLFITFFSSRAIHDDSTDTFRPSQQELRLLLCRTFRALPGGHDPHYDEGSHGHEPLCPLAGQRLQASLSERPEGERPVA